MLHDDPHRSGAVATTAYIDAYAELSALGAAVDGDPDDTTVFSDSTAPVVHPVGEELTTRALTCTDHPTTGRLTSETSGPEAQAFDYDLNGKRELSGGAAVHDLPDGIVQFGEWQYDHNPMGQRTGRYTVVDDPRVDETSDSYDVLGRLAEVDASGDVVAEDVFATQAHTPDLLVRANDGEIALRQDYDVWGRVTSTWTTPGLDLGPPVGFAGGLDDADTGLVRFGARDCDPVAGRWTAKDPIHGGGGLLNLFEHVGGDPVNLTDPSELVLPLAIVGAAAADGLASSTATEAGVLVGGAALNEQARRTDWARRAQQVPPWRGTRDSVMGSTTGPTQSAPCQAAKEAVRNSVPVELRAKRCQYSRCWK